MVRLRIGVAAIGLGVAVAVAGCSTTTQTATVGGDTSSSGSAKASTSASSAGNKAAAVGQTLNVTGENGVKAAVTLKSVTAHTTGTGDLEEKPKNGMYVVANIQIKVTAGSYDFNPLYFKVVSSDGNAYDETDGNAITAGFDPSLDSGTLGAGDTTGGNITFDVPSAHGTLQLTDPLSSTIGSWTF